MLKRVSYWTIIIIILLQGVISCKNKSEEVSLSTSSLEKDKAILRHLKEELWPKAYREQDTVLLDAVLDDSFKLIDGSGKTYSKQDELSWIKKNAVKHDSFNYEIQRLDIYDNNLAIVAGTGHIYEDSTYSIYASSNVLIKRDTIWKAISSHVSGYKLISE